MHTFFYYCITALETFKNAVISCDIAKLELFGDEYIFLYIQQYIDNKAYKLYITDTLKMIAENTAKSVGGLAPNKRYSDIIERKPVEKEKSAEEIINEVNARCGLTMIGGENE